MKNSPELKVKSKTLESEAKYIRREEQKLKRMCRWDSERQNPTTINYATLHRLRNHRVNELRKAARATFLARAFGAGKTYKTVENQGCKQGFERQYSVYKEVARMVKKYFDKDVSAEDILNWVEVKA